MSRSALPDGGLPLPKISKSSSVATPSSSRPANDTAVCVYCGDSGDASSIITGKKCADCKKSIRKEGCCAACANLELCDVSNHAAFIRWLVQRTRFSGKGGEAAAKAEWRASQKAQQPAKRVDGKRSRAGAGKNNYGELEDYDWFMTDPDDFDENDIDESVGPLCSKCTTAKHTALNRHKAFISWLLELSAFDDAAEAKEYWETWKSKFYDENTDDEEGTEDEQDEEKMQVDAMMMKQPPFYLSSDDDEDDDDE